jgi:c-di-GMP phosphodiesterase
MMDSTSSAKESKKERNINTKATEHNAISTHVLPITTDGAKSRQQEVLERLLKQQSIHDKSGRVTAIELSPRIRLSYDEDKKNAKLLRQSDDTTLVAGLFSLTEEGKQPRFPLLVSIDATTLLSDDIGYLPPHHVIFALDVTHGNIATLLPKLSQYQKEGYRLLLNYHYGSSIPPALSGQIRQARLEVGQLNATELEKATETLRHYGMRTLIASDIRCQESLECCIKLKFDEFQGSYFDHGPALPTKPTEINRLRLLELLDLVIARRGPDELETLIKFDARLSYQLIAYTNALEHNDTTINSLAQALQLLKHGDLYRWLTLLLHTSTDPAPATQALLKRGLSRAFFLEALARKSLQHTDPQAMYLMGLLSVMDQLTGHELPRLITPLRLSPEIKQALIEYKGVAGLMLRLVEAAESGEQSRIDDYAARCLINPVEANLAMINALVMAETNNLQPGPA